MARETGLVESPPEGDTTLPVPSANGLMVLERGGNVPLQPGNRNQFNAGLQSEFGRYIVFDGVHYNRTGAALPGATVLLQNPITQLLTIGDDGPNWVVPPRLRLCHAWPGLSALDDLTSQLAVSRWHEQIGDPTLADGILDRLVHNAHRIEMDSMRKSRVIRTSQVTISR
jgi:hypothetical protein